MVKIEPLFLRHALRLAVAVCIASLTASLFSLPHGLWVPMTVLIVLGTTVGGTLRKGMHRFWGTVFGLIVGTLLARAIHSHIAQDLILVLSFFIAYYARAFVMVNYGVFVVPITVTVVFVHSVYATADPLEILQDRLLNTLIGLGITLATSFIILPSKVVEQISLGRRRVASAMADYLEAITALALKGEPARASKRRLEKILVTHRLLFPNARYESVKWPHYRNFLHQIERGIQLLFALHNAVRKPLPEEFRSKLSAPLTTLSIQLCNLLNGQTWDREKVFEAVEAIHRAAPSDDWRDRSAQVAFELRDLALSLIELDALALR